MTTSLLPVSIIGCGYYVPERIMTNAEFESFLDTNDAWIRERTGIRERRIAPPEHALSDMAIPAAKQALEHAGVEASELDLIIVATSTPDMAMPATAALVQHAIGATPAAAFDMEAACSGFVYGTIVASQFLATGMYRTALVIGGDLLSKYINWKDRGTAVLFGDACGAVVLRGGDEKGLLGSYMGADGGGSAHIQIPLGSRVPPSAEMIEAMEHTVHMNGRETYKFAVEIVPKCVDEITQRTGVSVDEIDHFVLHQANYRIMEAAAKRMGVPMEKMIVNVDRMANSSAGTVPLALAEAVEAGTIKKGDLVCLVGFGSGLTWASALVRWTCDRPFPSRA
ncbi:ketoacyl-ACP synthase III [bacterium]|nr:ketoacyl-ACP synthase III [bacterium]